MALTSEERPKRFSDIVGQDEAVNILQSLAENPDRCPRSMVFRGSYGTGKTTSARVFARALNCKSEKELICQDCSSCQQDVLSSPYYLEFDSTDLGLSNIRDMKKQFSSKITVCNHKVICFDEAHTAPTKAQSSLLKTLEDSSNNMSFIFCTTDYEGLLNTIISRSLVLDFKLVDRESIFKLLKRLKKKKDIDVSKKSLYHIIESANGHVRDAVLSLDLCNQIGDGETFRKEIRTPERAILECLISLKREDEEDYKKRINKLKSNVLMNVKPSMESTILKLLKSHVDVEFNSPYSSLIEKVAQLYDNQLYKLLKAFSSDWFQNCFDSDETFESGLWTLRQLFRDASSNRKTNGHSETKEEDLQKFRKAEA